MPRPPHPAPDLLSTSGILGDQDWKQVVSDQGGDWGPSVSADAVGVTHARRPVVGGDLDNDQRGFLLHTMNGVLHRFGERHMFEFDFYRFNLDVLL